MANISDGEKSGSILAVLTAPFIALNTLLASIAEANSQIRRIKVLNQTSNAALEARGTTREAEIRRTFGVSAYLCAVDYNLGTGRLSSRIGRHHPS
jgi:hypothetical protein